MRASRRIAELEAEVADLRAIVAVLKGEAYMASATGLARKPVWAKGLNPQEHALVGLLLGAYPRYVDSFDLLDGLPSTTRAQERSTAQIRLLVCRIKKQLGKDTIKCQRGEGYALTKSGHDLLFDK